MLTIPLRFTINGRNTNNEVSRFKINLSLVCTCISKWVLEILCVISYPSRLSYFPMLLWLCLFWVKITFGNAFPYLRVFGCAWKIHFPKMVFSWPCVGCKLISVFILPSNTIFRKIERERAEWEWDRGRRERERAHPFGQRDRTQKEIEPRAQSCSTSTSPFDFESHPSTSLFDVTVRLHPSTSSFDDAVRLHPSTSPLRRSRSQSQHRFIVPDRERRTPKPIVLDPKPNGPPSLPSSLNLTGLWFFFFPAFYLRFWIEG